MAGAYRMGRQAPAALNKGRGPDMLFVILWIVLAVVVGWAASQKGRSGGGFFLMSLLLSPLVGLLVLIAVPARTAAAAAPAVATNAPPTATPSIGKYVLVGGGLSILLYVLANSEQKQPPSAPAVSTTSSPPVTARTDAPGLVFSNPSPSPEANRPLTAAEVREAQRLLFEQAFDPGTADGIAGPTTVAAVKRYEERRGLPITGSLDLRLLESLRARR